MTHPPRNSATPTPWECTAGFGGGLSIRRKGSAYRILDMVNNEQNHHDANAALIVRAVNSHDELLAACKSMVGLLDELYQQKGDHYTQKYAQLRAAIAAAEDGR